MNRIGASVNGKKAIAVDTALRLSRYFGVSPQFWLNLRSACDPELAEREILNLQPRGSLAKPYQVKQVREAIVRYKPAAGAQ
jgi:nitrogen regulatory protein PII-like uncharacterized protein